MRILFQLVALSLLLAGHARAQFEIPASLSHATLRTVLTNIFGTNTAFSS